MSGRVGEERDYGVLTLAMSMVCASTGLVKMGRIGSAPPRLRAQATAGHEWLPGLPGRSPQASFHTVKLIVTDIDGTLLRYEDYGLGPAAGALEACSRAGVPVVLCSSKTRTELEVLRERFSLSTPFITENGAAVYLPAVGPIPAAAHAVGSTQGWIVEETVGEGPVRLRIRLGMPREELSGHLEEIAGAAGIPVRGLSVMRADEVGKRLDLPVEEASLAMQREFSEPFAVEAEGPETTEEDRLKWLAALRQAAAEHGLRCTLGDRLFHLQGEHDKGAAVERLIAVYRHLLPGGSAPGGGALRVMGLGDSYNDAEMLAVVDDPVLVRRHDGSWATGIDAPGLLRTRGEGPEGWVEAVLPFLETPD